MLFAPPGKGHEGLHALALAAPSMLALNGELPRICDVVKVEVRLPTGRTTVRMLDEANGTVRKFDFDLCDPASAARAAREAVHATFN